ncbi:TonB-dependent receptor plug domain-containing protein [Pleionea sediminis]|uniref:TonB-dependent receptor plug domain-containing protein n=1 Tax=Pleionea sediminis TaxID=2569479 RepID=UPI001185AE9E|nr:TonB-dependent receptor [Pleionea sediminis]
MVETKSSLYKAVRAVLFPSLVATSLVSTVKAEEEGADKEKIIITGSRISRTESEGAATVVSMTADEMQQQGFTTLYEALNSFTSQTGAFTGEQFTRGFQPNAQALNLRGLGPGRTLILLDGRRVADYPSPYDGSSNFVNLSQFPMAMIERVEVMAGGASAIYGSDAMAGVVNIITKKSLDSHFAGIRLGDTERGGGASTRAQYYGGTEGDGYDALWSFEYYGVDPITGADRPYIGEKFTYTTLNPVDFRDENGDGFINYGNQSMCDSFGYGYTPFVDGGGNELDIGRCTDFQDTHRSLRNERDRVNLFGRFSMEIGDYSQFFTEVHLWDIQAKSNSGELFWSSGDNNVVTVIDQVDFLINGYHAPFFRNFPEIDSWVDHEEQGADIKIGYSGLINLEYDFELVLSHSFQESSDSSTRFETEAVESFYLGSLIVENFNFGGDIIDLYENPNFDLNRFVTPLTPAEIDQITGTNKDNKDSSVTTLSFTLTGDLFELGDDYVQFAAIAEYGKKEYEIELDPRTLTGGWFGLTGTEGSGERDRYALGIETRWPLHETLDMTLAGRYDSYDDDTDVGGAFTYNIGFEYRPIESLLLRATATSNFRAPDMHYVYAGEGGFFINVFDPFFAQTVNIQGVSNGVLELEEETGNTMSLGVVYEPTEDLSFSVDLYEIEVDDLVQPLDVTELMRGEVTCLLEPDTLPAAVCDDINSRITRDPNTFELESISLNPVNTSYSRQLGMDTSIKYNLNTDSFGLWSFHTNHTIVLKSERQLTEFSEVERDWRDDPFNNDLRSRWRGGFSWLMGDFRTSMLFNRIGSTNSQVQLLKRLDDWTTYNFSLSYMPTMDLTIDFIVNNLTDKKPYVEEGNTSWPYFNSSHYNAIGREVFIEAKYEF